MQTPHDSAPRALNFWSVTIYSFGNPGFLMVNLHTFSHWRMLFFFFFFFFIRHKSHFLCRCLYTCRYVNHFLIAGFIISVSYVLDIDCHVST